MNNPTKEYSHYSDDLLFNHAYRSSTSSFPSHIHDIWELLFVKKGSISYTVEGKTYQLVKNNLVITRPLQIHSISINTQTEYERYNILFNEKKLSSDIYQQLSSDVDVINFDGNSIISDLFKKMDYYCENLNGNSLEVVLLHLIEEILYNVLIVSKNFHQNNVYTVNPLINAAIEYIEQHITLPINVNTICDELHITKSHLDNLFAKHLKITPKKYILSKKLTIAQRELRSGIKPTIVYINLGFTDYTTFYRAYKNYFGHSPSDETNIKILRRIES